MEQHLPSHVYSMDCIYLSQKVGPVRCPQGSALKQSTLSSDVLWCVLVMIFLYAADSLEERATIPGEMSCHGHVRDVGWLTAVCGKGRCARDVSAK